jgi:hypothetical protein
MYLSFCKFLLSALLLDGVTQCCFAQGVDKPILDPNRLWEVERWVVVTPDDAIDGLAHLSDEERKVRIAKQKLDLQLREQSRLSRIVNEPGLGPYLVYLVHQYLGGPSRDGLPILLEAVAMRQDISQKDLERFFSLVKAILSDSKSVVQPTSDDFLVGMASVMAAHPSAENEAMLVKMLHLREDFTGVHLKIAAGKALALSGSPRVWGDMVRTSKWFDNFKDLTGGTELAVLRAALFNRYVSQLRDRLSKSSGARTEMTTMPDTSLPREENVIELSSTVNASKDISYRAVVAAIAALGVSVMWILLKTRR